MRSNTKITFSRYNKGADCPVEGCVFPLERRGSLTYFPTNTENLIIIASGGLRAEYQDGDVQVYANPYSNTWSSYIEPWNCDKPLQAYIRSENDVVIKVTTVNATTSQITFSVATIVNEEITKVTDKRSFVYVYGSDFLYTKDGNAVVANTQNFGVSFGQMAGNTSTHSITANSSPVTVIFIEEN